MSSYVLYNYLVLAIKFLKMNKNNTSHIFLLVVLIIIAIVMIFYSYNGSMKIDTPVNQEQAIEIEKVKEKILTDEQVDKKLYILSVVKRGDVPTPKEKSDIFDAISGSNINNYNFTPEETKAIVNALNRK